MDRDCNKCVYHTSGMCSRWKCEGTKTIDDIRSEEREKILHEYNGFYFCPRCGKRSAVWQSDCDATEIGSDKDGLVSFFKCSECGSDIEVTTLEKDD